MNNTIFINCLLAVYAAQLLKRLTHRLYWVIKRKYDPSLELGRAKSGGYELEYMDVSEMDEATKSEWNEYFEHIKNSGRTMQCKIVINDKVMVHIMDWYDFLQWKEKYSS